MFFLYFASWILRVPFRRYFGDLEVLLAGFWGATGGLGAHLRGLWDPIGDHWELSGSPSGSIL